MSCYALGLSGMSSARSMQPTVARHVHVTRNVQQVRVISYSNYNDMARVILHQIGCDSAQTETSDERRRSARSSYASKVTDAEQTTTTQSQTNGEFVRAQPLNKRSCC